MEEDGSHQRQLTFGANYDDHPALFSDQQHILYSEFNGATFPPWDGARLVRLGNKSSPARAKSTAKRRVAPYTTPPSARSRTGWCTTTTAATEGHCASVGGRKVMRSR